MADDLNTPLGQDRKPSRSKLPRLVPWTIAAALGLGLAVFVGWAAAVEDPLGGEPIVVVAAEPRVPAAKTPDEAAATAPKANTETDTKSGTADAKQAEPAKTPPTGLQTVTIIDGGTGNRQEVTVPAQGGQSAAPADAKLLESTRHGMIPRVSADGARPLVAYARPVGENKSKMPRIALVTAPASSSGTGEAPKLPAAVSLAFAPYGSDLERIAAQRRRAGFCSCRWSCSIIRTMIRAADAPHPAAPEQTPTACLVGPLGYVGVATWARFTRAACSADARGGLSAAGYLTRLIAASLAGPDRHRRGPVRQGEPRLMPWPERGRPRADAARKPARDNDIAVGVATWRLSVGRALRWGRRRNRAGSRWPRSAPRSPLRPTLGASSKTRQLISSHARAVATPAGQRACGSMRHSGS